MISATSRRHRDLKHGYIHFSSSMSEQEEKTQKHNIIQALILMGEGGNCKYTSGNCPVAGLPRGQKKKLIHVQLGLPLIASDPDLQEDHLPKPGVCICSFISH